MNTPEHIVPYGLGSPSRSKRSLKDLFATKATDHRNRCQCASQKDKKCWTFCQVGKELRGQDSMEKGWDDQKKGKDCSELGEKCTHHQLVAGRKIRRLDAVRNSIKTAFRVAKLKAEIYREKKVTHNRTHWLMAGGRGLSHAISSPEGTLWLILHSLHMAGIRAKASSLLRPFLAPHWQRASVLTVNIPGKVKESPQSVFICFHQWWPLLSFLIWGDSWTTQKAERYSDLWIRVAPSRGRTGDSTRSGISEEGPKGVFVSHSGAWHVSGRSSKVHAKIF